jgi:hypothetical protein
VLTLAQLATSETHREGHLSVHRQLPNGGFAAATDYAVEIYPWHFVIADLDADGAPDVVVVDPDDAHAVTWLRQDPTSPGRFLSPVRLLSGVHASDVALADLNGDGSTDIAIADQAGSSARIVMLPQDPVTAGTFGAPVDVALPGTSDAVAAADLDGDGLVDLAVGYLAPTGTAYVYDASLAILSQQPGGGFSPAQPQATRRGVNVDRLRIADYDGDGSPDLIAFMSASSLDSTPRLLAVLRGGSGAPRTVETSLAQVQGRDDAAFGDFDGDGRLDAALAGFFPVGSPSTVESRLNLFRQLADGTLQGPESRSLPIPVSRIAAGDVDGDGRPDLVLLGEANRVLLMLQSQSGGGEFLAPEALP